MNSLYGKFGQKLERVDESQITEDEDLLLRLYSQGLLHGVNPINDRYMSYSATNIQTIDASCGTNFMIAAFITARGRINLHSGIMTISKEYPKAVVAYTDTDSIYVGNMEHVNTEGPFYKRFVDGARLGAYKPEMDGKIGAPTG
jgi:hypothetical protein